ncbi:uncharacterized protein LOC113305271 [Papaver somniferum]|uniref:uncharacterized protein LOC113305271 n=1 Tax=Papaver somniferum TaxID=3469 RepID=UPI000E6F5FBE|nr:uncharacterized protein LOC113305271 [Papaver somniferum]
MAANSPTINHFLFADDCLIFTQSNLSSINNLLDILHNFSTQSGQILGVKTMNSKERYLGSPLLLGHSKQEAFKAIEDNFMNKYSTWSYTSLTQAERSTMIKHVCDSIPNYQMGGLSFSLIDGAVFWSRVDPAPAVDSRSAALAAFLPSCTGGLSFSLIDGAFFWSRVDPAPAVDSRSAALAAFLPSCIGLRVVLLLLMVYELK